MPLQESHKLPYREFISFSERSQLACKIRNLALDSTKKRRRKFDCIGSMWWFFQTSVKGNFTNYHGNLTLKRFAGSWIWVTLWELTCCEVTGICYSHMVSSGAWYKESRISWELLSYKVRAEWIPSQYGGGVKKRGCRRGRYVNLGGRKGRALRCHENVGKLTFFLNSDLSSCSYSTALWARDS